MCHFGRVLIITADAVGPPTGTAGAGPEGRGYRRTSPAWQPGKTQKSRSPPEIPHESVKELQDAARAIIRDSEPRLKMDSFQDKLLTKTFVWTPCLPIHQRSFSRRSTIEVFCDYKENYGRLPPVCRCGATNAGCCSCGGSVPSPRPSQPATATGYCWCCRFSAEPGA